MPWLVLLACSQVYAPFRIAGAALTGIAATAWFSERAFGWGNPIVPVVESLASHALWLLIGLTVLSVAATAATLLSRANPKMPRLGDAKSHV